ncbi:MAG: hypothetical protein M0C28_15260 [Candidatus Moduliflexus flocculans]|nr:hypothetical protein [Candidatus Moduliflexus flocculans]
MRRGAGFVVAGQARPVRRPVGGRAGSRPGRRDGRRRPRRGLARGHAAPPGSRRLRRIQEDARPALGRDPAAKDAFAAAAALLASRGPAVVLFDAGSVAGPAGLETLGWLRNIALLIGGRLVALGRGANERGVHELERALGPRRPGRDLEDVRDGLGEFTADALYLAGPASDLGRPEAVVPRLPGHALEPRTPSGPTSSCRPPRSPSAAGPGSTRRAA